MVEVSPNLFEAALTWLGGIFSALFLIFAPGEPEPSWLPDASLRPGLTLAIGEEVLALGSEQITNVMLMDDPSGNPMLMIEYDSAAADAIGGLTAQHLMQELEVRLCEIVIARPRVMQPIYTRSVHLSGGFDWDQAFTVLGVIGGDQPCANLQGMGLQ